MILTDDSVASIDVGAVAWLLLAYGDQLKRHHVLDKDAYARHLERLDDEGAEPGTSPAENAEARAKRANKLSKKSWKVLKACRVRGAGNEKKKK